MRVGSEQSGGGIIELEFLAPRVRAGEAISKVNFNRALDAIRRASSAVMRLSVLRTVTADFKLDAAAATVILTALPPGLEREEGLVLLWSRMNARAIPGLARLMGTAR